MSPMLGLQMRAALPWPAFICSCWESHTSPHASMACIFTNRVISSSSRKKCFLFPKFICQAMRSQHEGDWTRGIRPFYFILFVAIYVWLFRKQISKITHTWTLNVIKANQIFVYRCSPTFCFLPPPLYSSPHHTHKPFTLLQGCWEWTKLAVVLSPSPRPGPDPRRALAALLQSRDCGEGKNSTAEVTTMGLLWRSPGPA